MQRYASITPRVVKQTCCTRLHENRGRKHRVLLATHGQRLLLVRQTGLQLVIVGLVDLFDDWRFMMLHEGAELATEGFL